jgi:hypothetical protein
MKVSNKGFIIPITALIILVSCNTLEKASIHGFHSGYYKLQTKEEKAQTVYADVTDEKVDVYRLSNNQPGKNVLLTIPLVPKDSLMTNTLVFKKQSLDIDITSILLKYRPSVYGLKPQLNADFNIAMYAGWRYDYHYIVSKKDPLGKSFNKKFHRGFDFGVFAGPGTTLISPFTTNNSRTNEYTGLIIQTGVAGFIESNVASFGFAGGLDHLLNADREVWIYRHKPWVGFIVGIALN